MLALLLHSTMGYFSELMLERRVELPSGVKGGDSIEGGGVEGGDSVEGGGGGDVASQEDDGEDGETSELPGVGAFDGW